MIDNLERKEVTNYISSEYLEHYMLNDSTSKDENPKVGMSAHF